MWVKIISFWLRHCSNASATVQNSNCIWTGRQWTMNTITGENALVEFSSRCTHISFKRKKKKKKVFLAESREQQMASSICSFSESAQDRRCASMYSEEPYFNFNLTFWYSEPSLQRQHLFPKTLPLKWIFYYTEYLMSRLICKNGLVLFLFPHRTYVLDIC